MYKVSWKFPPSIQYGQVKVEFEVSAEDYDPFELGREYALAMVKFRNGEEAAIKGDTAPAKSVAVKAEPKVDNPKATASPEEAAKMITEQLGATTLSEDVYDAPVATAPKPWENKPSFDFDN